MGARCPGWDPQAGASQPVQPLRGWWKIFDPCPGVAPHPGLVLLNPSGVGMEPAALAHELTLATRHVADFKDANVPLLDPWTAN